MPTESKQGAVIEEIAPFEAAEEIEGGDVVLVDTREPHEYDEAHLDGARWVRRGILEDETRSVVPDRDRRVLLYCRTGNRSGKAAEQMAALGYGNVANVEGGILAWQEQGLPVVEAEGLSAEQRGRYSG